MPRLALVFLCSLIIIPSGAHPRALSPSIHLGLTFANHIEKASIDGPGFALGAGLEHPVGSVIHLGGRAVYTYFPSNDEERYVVVPQFFGAPNSDSSFGKPHQALDVSVGIRLKGMNRGPGMHPYFLFGAGVSWLSKGGFPGTTSGRGETTGDVFGTVGFGLEWPVSTGTHAVVEFAPLFVFERNGAYLPFRVGLRF
jgi:hypothetical protein